MLLSPRPDTSLIFFSLPDQCDDTLHTDPRNNLGYGLLGCDTLESGRWHHTLEDRSLNTQRPENPMSHMP
jgi:hypothetical protein